MPNIILDNVTINQPVADLTALEAIPKGGLANGCVCFVNSENAFYYFIIGTLSWAKLVSAIPSIPIANSSGSTITGPIILQVDGFNAGYFQVVPCTTGQPFCFFAGTMISGGAGEGTQTFAGVLDYTGTPGIGGALYNNTADGTLTATPGGYIVGICAQATASTGVGIINIPNYSANSSPALPNYTDQYFLSQEVGNNSFSGLNLAEQKQTWMGVVAVATASPASIECTDGANYQEEVTLGTNGLFINAPNATLYAPTNTFALTIPDSMTGLVLNMNSIVGSGTSMNPGATVIVGNASLVFLNFAQGIFNPGYAAISFTSSTVGSLTCPWVVGDIDFGGSALSVNILKHDGNVLNAENIVGQVGNQFYNMETAIGGDTVPGRIYVAKYGNDSNPGNNPFLPKLTFNGANSGASAVSADLIVCLDSGTYSEQLSPSIPVDAPYATLTSSGTTPTLNVSVKGVYNFAHVVNTSLTPTAAVHDTLGNGVTFNIGEISGTVSLGFTTANYTGNDSSILNVDSYNCAILDLNSSSTLVNVKTSSTLPITVVACPNIIGAINNDQFGMPSFNSKIVHTYTTVATFTEINAGIVLINTDDQFDAQFNVVDVTMIITTALAGTGNIQVGNASTPTSVFTVPVSALATSGQIINSGSTTTLGTNYYSMGSVGFGVFDTTGALLKATTSGTLSAGEVTFIVNYAQNQVGN